MCLKVLYEPMFATCFQSFVLVMIEFTVLYCYRDQISNFKYSCAYVLYAYCILIMKFICTMHFVSNCSLFSNTANFETVILATLNVN
jgi:hypothetical protein